MNKHRLGVSLSLIGFVVLAGCTNLPPTPPAENQTQETQISSQETQIKATDVDFIKPSKIDTQMISTDEQREILAKHFEGSTEKMEWSQIENLFKWYEVGTIKTKPYKGWTLLVLDYQCEGPCFTATVFRFAWDKQSGKKIFLKHHLSEGNMTAENVLNFISPLLKDTDSSTTLASLELPDRLLMPDGHSFIDKMQEDRFYLYENLTDIAFTTSEGIKVYFADKNAGGVGCLYVPRPDGSVSVYTFNTGFFKGADNIAIEKESKKEINITQNYAPTNRGCGVEGACYYVEAPTFKKEDNLKLFATSQNGIDLYEVDNSLKRNSASPAQQKLAEIYQVYTSSYEYRQDKKTPNPLTFAEFTAKKPLLFWQDPLGRWSSITAVDVAPMAECGKPVIYLYPQKTTDVHVQVGIDELTKTIPEYGPQGWSVRAEPSGDLYNYADGQSYPYLFWEGKKKNGLNVDEGFVIARDQINSFLPSSLQSLGLNEKETADFLEFWYPRMMENNEPYFLISFIGTNDFNKIAPLQIEPKPDTLIRVFMYYQPLSTPFKIRAQKLTSIPRRGFTVLEWGGTSSKPWAY